MKLTHPASPEAEAFVTTEDAYESVWKERGWVPVPEAVAVPVDAAGNPVAVPVDAAGNPVAVVTEKPATPASPLKP